MNRSLVFIALFMLALVACGSLQSGNPAPATAVLVPYQSSTSTQTPQIVASELPSASSTPLIYTVVANDTLINIAERFKISLDALEAANPNISPRFLMPGTKLLIPIEGQSLATVVPTLTPVSAITSSPQCYSTAARELWCFLLVENPSDQTIENLSGRVQLVSQDGAVLADLEADAPLDILPAGARMPLVAYLADPPDGWVSAQGQILTGFLLPHGDETYLKVEAVDFDWFSTDSTRLIAHVVGQVRLAENVPANSVWVLAVAYDSKGQVIGVRRWESSRELNFDFWIYSLGPEIDDVQVLAEVRP